ncbi:MAG: ABC transporter permease subunit [Bacteroidetes bacterium]|nr:ABC transporter permease subunit [Bacteroidota bacterium]
MTALLLLTLYELRARKIILGLFGVATLVWVVLALALQLDVIEGSLAGIRFFGDEMVGESEFASGNQELPFGNSMLQTFVFGAEMFAAGAAYWVGILLALFATGGLIASMLERGQVDLLLTKPLSRSKILIGRLLGVSVVMLALLIYLLGAVWLVMSIKTGVWNPRFLIAIGIVFIMFMVLYSLITITSVWTGSAPLALILTFGLLFATLILAIEPLRDQITQPGRSLVIAFYNVLPKFVDVGAYIVPQLVSGQPVESWSPLVSSLAFGIIAYAGAFWLFQRKDF